MKKNISHLSFFQKNKEYINSYKKNALMQLMDSKKIESKKTRIILMDCIQTLSDYFQKVVMLRNVFNDDPSYTSITQEHLKEEFFHNVSLMKDRKNRPALWDPILEATSAWFAWKMFTLNNAEKTVLVHFVLESSGNLFFQKAYKIMRKYEKTNYFKIHSEADEEHEKMGEELLNNVSKENFPRLLKVLQQGWDVMNAACNRIAELTNQIQ
ncbi:MAG: hypothetical protein SFW07_03835 [Gammaproteobacteria bacterium]|nr:hypothetical protein [Gammaproteobacteria bacterium]